MKSDAQAMKLTELLKKADSHPMMKAIIEEEASVVLAQREEAAGKIAALKAEQSETIPRLQADLAEKEAEFNKAKAAMDAALTEFRQARSKLSGKSFHISHQIGLQNQILIETAAAEIDEAIQFFRDKLDFLRSPGRINLRALGVERNLFAWKKNVKGESNLNAVHSALAYCRDAIKQLELMKLTPALDVEKIEQIKAGIPSIDVYSEVSGERSLPRVSINPLDSLPSDSEMNRKKNKLLQKADKVLKKH